MSIVNMARLMNTPSPLVLVTATALLWAGCTPSPTATGDLEQDKKLAELQAQIEGLNAQSQQLRQELAERELALKSSEEQARLNALDTQRARLEEKERILAQERAELEAERSRAIAAEPDLMPPAQGPSSQAPSDTGSSGGYEVFYDSLASEGEWFDSTDYGYIWRPNVVVRQPGWRPYVDGRWVYTDAAWTWESNEPFGWATYHYGRWVLLASSGWCWVPGTEWAPAWVSWQANDDYIGWAPLPPEASFDRGRGISAELAVSYNTGPTLYNFVEVTEFGEDTYLGRIVEPSRNLTILYQTTNITRLSWNNTIIVNHGPSYDRIRPRTRNKLDTYRLDFQRSDRVDSRRKNNFVRGDRLTVAAPVIDRIDRSENPPRPARISKKIVQTEREKGWRGVSAQDRERIINRPNRIAKPSAATSSEDPAPTPRDQTASPGADATPSGTSPAIRKPANRQEQIGQRVAQEQARRRAEAERQRVTPLPESLSEEDISLNRPHQVPGRKAPDPNLRGDPVSEKIEKPASPTDPVPAPTAEPDRPTRPRSTGPVDPNGQDRGVRPGSRPETGERPNSEGDQQENRPIEQIRQQELGETRALEKDQRRQRDVAEQTANAEREAQREAQQNADREAQRNAQREAQQNAEREAQRNAQREAQQNAEREAQRNAQREAQQNAEREAQRNAQREAQQNAEREAQRNAQREAQQNAEKEARRNQEIQARQNEAQQQQRAEREQQREAARQREASEKANQQRPRRDTRNSPAPTEESSDEQPREQRMFRGQSL